MIGRGSGGNTGNSLLIGADTPTAIANMSMDAG